MGRENDSPIQYERLVNGRPEYAAPGPFHRHGMRQNGSHAVLLLIIIIKKKVYSIRFEA